MKNYELAVGIDVTKKTLDVSIHNQSLPIFCLALQQILEQGKIQKPARLLKRIKNFNIELSKVQ